jgi:hypothetical protein
MKAASFATLINQKVLMPSVRTQYVAVDRDHLVDLLKTTLRTIYVDVEWYLQNNPDIAQAIENGIVENAQDHYITYGYYEHRMPYEITVEENWYLSQYSDVNEAVSKGMFSSARDHYYIAGFKEGRLPHAGFTLRLVGSGS